MESENYRAVKTDLHNHLRTRSRISVNDLSKLARLARKRLGAGAVVGLVNFEDWRFEEAINRSVTSMNFGNMDYQELGNAVLMDNDVLIVKGQEVPTADGHLLVIGLDAGERIEAGRSLVETLNTVEEHDALAIADHPFFDSGLGKFFDPSSKSYNPEIVRRFHGYEIQNGEAGFRLSPKNTFSANKDSRKIFKKISAEFPNLAPISASDGHSMYEVGRNWTGMEMPESYEANITDGDNVLDYIEHGLASVSRDCLHGFGFSTSYRGAINHGIDLKVIQRVDRICAILKRQSPFKRDVADQSELYAPRRNLLEFPSHKS